MEMLINFIVLKGTSISYYLSELRLLVANVKILGRELALGDKSLHPAIKLGVDDQ